MKGLMFQYTSHLLNKNECIIFVSMIYGCKSCLNSFRCIATICRIPRQQRCHDLLPTLILALPTKAANPDNHVAITTSRVNCYKAAHIISISEMKMMLQRMLFPLLSSIHQSFYGFSGQLYQTKKIYAELSFLRIKILG